MPMTADDGRHYAYQCHACAMHEHDVTVALRTDPDHPDRWVLAENPVDLGAGRKGRGPQAKVAFMSSVLSRPTAS